MIIVGAVTCIVVLLAVTAPFFLGAGGTLAAGVSQNSPELLERVKTAVLKRYLEEEQAAAAKVIGRRTWETRKKFLLNRYMDAARRLDFVAHVNSGAVADE